MQINKTPWAILCTVLLALCACSRQQSDWQKTREANTADSYELFVKKYPSGEFTAQAQARLKELYEERDWQKARDADTQEAYQGFLKQYPEGKWTEEARIRVENFTLASAPSTPPPAGTETPPPQAAPPPAPTPKPAAKAPAPSAHAAMKPQGSYGVQLGAFKSGADAANTRWARLDKEYPTLFSGLTPKVSPKKAASGTLYRLQVANLSEKRANSICQKLKAQRQACVLLHP